MKIKKIKGQVSTETVITDNLSKEEVFRETTRKELDAMDGNAFPVGLVGYALPVKLSGGFQSVGLEVRVDLPWRFPDGDRDRLKASVREAIDFAEEVVDEAVAERMDRVEEILQSLIDKGKKYR
jgi:hypothetical protein